MSAVYKDLSGAGSVLAARMAIEDFGGGFPISLVDADHHNEADQAGRIARDWLEHGKVDVIVDVPNNAAALEVIKAGMLCYEDCTARLFSASIIACGFSRWMKWPAPGTTSRPRFLAINVLTCCNCY